ncbi:hypothetical protein AGMMS49992_03030 [Clostridia bacterium]|nr:hypothetical protein AGMMS49992_03030 [Clostridia bacterium]
MKEQYGGGALYARTIAAIGTNILMLGHDGLLMYDGMEGKLYIYEPEARVVREIYEWYLSGHSVVSIIYKLHQAYIQSPSDKDKWSKRCLELMLRNEKYVGDVLVGKTWGSAYPSRKRHYNDGEVNMYLIPSHHDPIVTRTLFDAVQAERIRRSNVIIENGIKKRSSVKHSTKIALEGSMKKEPIDE